MAANSRSCQNEDYSDRELARLLEEMAGEEDWVLVGDLAERLALEPRMVAARLGWMRRLGLVEKHPDYGKLRAPAADVPAEPVRLWRLTELGLQLSRGQLARSMRERLEKLREGDLLDLTSLITQRYREGDVNTAYLIRRDIRWGLSKRRF